MSHCKALLWSILIFAAALQPLAATTIISVAGTDMGPFAVYGGQYLASSWSEDGTYKNVETSAKLSGSAVTGPAVGTAYLMTQIGPGTTTAEQIAAAPAKFAPGTAQKILFSGLTLGPAPIIWSCRLPRAAALPAVGSAQFRLTLPSQARLSSPPRE